MAAFPISASAAAKLIPGEEIQPVRLGGDVGLLVVTVVNYITTDIGSYIEFSIAIACRRGLSVGQWVVDLPVSTEISVKGGKGIWGMPKHQANIDFVERADKVWSQYDLDGQLCCRIEVDRPRLKGIPMPRISAVNYCAFRGMLCKSWISFKGRAGVNLPFSRSARLTLGDHPRMAPLKTLQVRERPLFTAFLEDTRRDPRRPHGELVPDLRGAADHRARGPGERRRPRPRAGVARAAQRPGGRAMKTLERRALRAIGGVTALTGAVQAAAPQLTLRPLQADDAPAVRHFFGTVGMFMVCTGSVSVARPDDRAVVAMVAAQKLGAAVAVSLAVKRGLLSPLALGVAGFDAFSALLAADYWRRI